MITGVDHVVPGGSRFPSREMINKVKLVNVLINANYNFVLTRIFDG